MATMSARSRVAVCWRCPGDTDIVARAQAAFEEVDNDLGFTRHFLPPSLQPDPAPDEICVILAAIMAHGCNIGPHTMAQLTADVTYEQLKRVGDWQLTRDGAARGSSSDTSHSRVASLTTDSLKTLIYLKRSLT